MRVDGQLVEKPYKSSSKKIRRRQKKAGSMQSAVQRLYDVCKDVFADGGAGVVPPPEDVERIRSVLDSLTPADVGLSPNLPFFKKTEYKGPPAVRYLHLYDCPRFSIGIFCLPPTSCIPLHNHPGMTVFSKLLFGSMHIKSYDWVDVPENFNQPLKSGHFQPPGMRLAKLHRDAVFTTPCETSILYPLAGGNMHRFTAVTSCAVLDVLGPPYSDAEGRPCMYYNDFPYASFSGDTDSVPGNGDEYAWLEEKAKPDEFFVLGAKYTGPKIIER
ncbi:plant cysteine oxidase 2-like [Dioscorea cayenensis subsp. rotundata]|uniref:cysteine dioxygenase n=1 Tax=Dioscorea cayennensis subsp. rotundata TaxID=55577 RepID=A0AB40ANA8_DIOCR|nr:plant cysteine oxidase 2-like [Dioscorea cayenensis subsp. rotundata]